MLAESYFIFFLPAYFVTLIRKRIEETKLIFSSKSLSSVVGRTAPLPRYQLPVWL